MKIECVQDREPGLAEFFSKRIEEFNLERWDVKKKVPLAVKITGEGGEIAGGAAGKTFGFWLLLDNLWVHESLRGQDWGTRILQEMETAAGARGCKYVLLDTLGFQARPFYEKHGYRLAWTQNDYPKTGCKYFMTKTL